MTNTTNDKVSMDNEEKAAALETLRNTGFQRISDAIEFLWGNKECADYFQKLIIDDRGDRAGFPREALLALLKLHNIHTKQFNFDDPNDKFAITLGR